MDEYIDRVTCKVCGERLDKMDITTAQVHLSQHITDIGNALNAHAHSTSDRGYTGPAYEHPEGFVGYMWEQKHAAH